jgi:plasmid stability protein
MASLLIRKLDEALKSRLRIRAAQRGHSMEEEAREILRLALAAESSRPLNLAEAIRRHVTPFGGVDLEIAPREAVRRPPDLKS